MFRLLSGTVVGIALGLGCWGLIRPHLPELSARSSVQAGLVQLLQTRTCAPDALPPLDTWLWALVGDPTLYLFDMVGTVAFGVTGALAALLVLRPTGGHNALALIAASLLTGVGGGTVRCKLLGVTPFVLTAPEYFIAAAFPGLIAVMVPSLLERTQKLWTHLDHLGVGVFAVIGARAALGVGLPDVVAVLCGALTAAGGGLLRDVLVLGRPPASFRRGAWYAEAAMLTALVYLHAGGMMPDAQAARLAAATGFGLRLAGDVLLSRRAGARAAHVATAVEQ